jgi:hypothetical protein
MVMPIDLQHLTQVSLTAGALILSGCAANTLLIAQDRGTGAEQAEVEPTAPAPAAEPKSEPEDPAGVKDPSKPTFDGGPIGGPIDEGLSFEGS